MIYVILCWHVRYFTKLSLSNIVLVLNLFIFWIKAEKLKQN